MCIRDRTSDVGLTKAGEIILGKFVDRERPDYQQMMSAHLHEELGDRYIEMEEPVCS